VIRLPWFPLQNARGFVLVPRMGRLSTGRDEATRADQAEQEKIESRGGKQKSA